LEVKMIMQVSFKKYDWIDQNLIKVECLNSLLNLLFSTLLYQLGLLLTMDSWFSQMQLQFILPLLLDTNQDNAAQLLNG